MLATSIGVSIGLVLGLTGAGGSIFAVPLLIIFLGLPVQEAMGISLGVIAVSSLFGVTQRIGLKLIMLTPALLLASSGALIAPIGKWVATFTDANYLIIGFVLLSIIVAIRMWRQVSKYPEEAVIVRASQFEKQDSTELLCKFGDEGKFELKPRCIIGLFVGGAGIGFLTGLLGVGGGFLIVPLLMYLSQVDIKKAISTSLLIISIISLSGFISFYFLSDGFEWILPGKIVIGGIVGMLVGTKISIYVSGARLQKYFSVAIVIFSIITLVNHF
jgi:uncharacterized protein